LIALLLTLVLFLAPAAGFWLLVGGLDPIGRLVVATLASMVVVSTVAGVMLIFGLWSPPLGFVAVLAVSGLFALLGWRWHGRPVPAATPGPAPRPPFQPRTPQQPDAEGDEWIFEA
jgi:protein-S-isoprenylcysteine O-methyltransferase Ste14